MKARWGAAGRELPDDHPAWALEARYLALALDNFVCTLSPRRIILGGGVMERLALFPMIHRELQALLGGYVQAPQVTTHIDRYVVPPAFGPRAGIMGALALASDPRTPDVSCLRRRRSPPWRAEWVCGGEQPRPSWGSSLPGVPPAPVRPPPRRPRPRPVPAGARRPHERLADRYVSLVLALGVHDPDYVDAYYGPPEKRAEAEAAKRPLPEIRASAVALLGELESVRPPGGRARQPAPSVPHAASSSPWSAAWTCGRAGRWASTRNRRPSTTRCRRRRAKTTSGRSSPSWTAPARLRSPDRPLQGASSTTT